MSTEVTLIGNEGFVIKTESHTILIDPFYAAIPGVAGKRTIRPEDVAEADLILVTHSHWDHFRANEVAEVADRTGAAVVGPQDVAGRVRKKAANGNPIAMEPQEPERGKPYDRVAADVGEIKVTAFRTHHGRGHNSYLVEAPTFRFFHDGDNEDTRRLEPSLLQGLDALLIGPWQGSGWVELIEAVAAKRYFLMHLTDEEIDEIEAGTFLPAICDHVPRPDTLVVLRPGESFVFE